jgi:flagellar biogenesis protein FliO
VGGAWAICLGALGAALYFLRRHIRGRNTQTSKGLVHLLEALRVAPQTLLYVVEFDGRMYLLAQTQQGVSQIAASGNPPVHEGP